MLAWRNSCFSHLPITSRGKPAHFGDQQVEIRSRLVSTHCCLPKNKRTGKRCSWLLKNFEGLSTTKVRYWKNFKVQRHMSLTSPAHWYHVQANLICDTALFIVKSSVFPSDFLLFHSVTVQISPHASDSFGPCHLSIHYSDSVRLFLSWLMPRINN